MGQVIKFTSLKTIIHEAVEMGCDSTEVKSMFLGNKDAALFGITFTLRYVQPGSREYSAWQKLYDFIKKMPLSRYLSLCQEALTDFPVE